MSVLVADTSVLIDLERAGLLPHVFRGPDTFVTPDFLYQSELEEENGPELLALGLQLLELSGAEMSALQELAAAHPGLSLPDGAAYVGACRTDHALLTGDGELRRIATAHGLQVHGTLWVLDRMFDTGAATTIELHAGLSAMAGHRRARLPQDEVKRRLERWAREPSA